MTDKNDLPRIGMIEFVSLPEHSIQAVPAKIDTGADSSAIWASTIVEQHSTLSFVLFGKNSPFYNGQIITTQKYKVVSIKNSFGIAEFRYKVPLKITVGGRTIRATFTLANRESNRYPILIGRRTLHGKFLVDVTRRPKKETFQVLMLSTKRTTVTEKFARSLEAHSKKLEITYASYEDLCFVTGQDGNKVILRESGRDIASFDLVYFKTFAKYMDVAASAAQYLQQRKVPFMDTAIRHFPNTSKLYQYVILTDADMLVPQSVFMLPGVMETSFNYLKDQLGLPFVLKDIHGNKGEHNYLVKNQAGFKKACQQIKTEGVQCIAQIFIPNEGDYRVLVFGAKVELIIKRTRLCDKTHLNNTSQGASAEIIPATIFPPHVQRQCVAAAKLLERQVAGVDIVQDKLSSMWYCLEVNDGPQLATGSFTEEKHAAFAAYLNRRLHK